MNEPTLSDPIVLDHDPESGITEYYYGHGDGGFTIETRQDVTDLVETNKALANDATGRWGEMARIASYPLCIWWENTRKGVYQDDKEHRRFLNDPDNSVFRTKFGKV